MVEDWGLVLFEEEKVGGVVFEVVVDVFVVFFVVPMFLEPLLLLLLVFSLGMLPMAGRVIGGRRRGRRLGRHCAGGILRQRRFREIQNMISKIRLETSFEEQTTPRTPRQARLEFFPTYVYDIFNKNSASKNRLFVEI